MRGLESKIILFPDLDFPFERFEAALQRCVDKAKSKLLLYSTENSQNDNVAYSFVTLALSQCPNGFEGNSCVFKSQMFHPYICCSGKP